MKANDEITSLDHFQKIISRYEIVYPGKLFFRGENEYFDTRSPGILRNDQWTQHESDFYQELVKMHQSEFSNAPDYIDRLALMQHYGAPTRLLDVSVNPYISLYFASEDSPNNDDGYLYMYVRKPVHKDDVSVRMLSWMACNKWDSLEYACRSYEIRYAESINITDIKALIDQPQFLCQSDFNGTDNARLKAQKGTFVICGERYVNDQWKISTLDSILPVLVFRIPVEFKKSIRKELDQYGINESSIYTDLASAAKYLRDKYNPQIETVDESDYEIKEKDSTSPSYRRTLKLYVVFNKKYSIAAIHRALKTIVDKNRENADAIFIYTAMSEKDYVAYNYRTRMLWINPDWKYKDKFAPKPFSNVEDDSYSWEDSNGSSIVSEYYDNNIYSQSPEYIYKSAYTLFDEALPIFTLYDKAWKEGGKPKLQQQIKDKDDEVSNIQDEWGEVGISTNKEVNLFLDCFDWLFNELQFLPLYLKEDDYERIINDQFASMQKDIEEIQNKKEWLKDELNINDSELEEIIPLSKHRVKKGFLQTIPMSDNPLEVYFRVRCFLTDRGGISINAETNLYDHADLKVNVFDLTNNSKIGNSQGIVNNGHVDFEVIKPMDALESGTDIKVRITLSIPGLQDIDFIKKAGMQYENLANGFIDRSSSVGPTGKYETIIALNNRIQDKKCV